MKTKGIRILDKENNLVSVELPDILEKIPEGNLFSWSILYLEATGHLGEDKSIPVFEEQILKSEKGFYITWDDLKLLASKLWDVMDLVLIGCKDKNLLHRYENDQEMYETCDVVIEMFDSSYWEIFSKDDQLLLRLEKKFREVLNLTSDFNAQ
jgi:hypothetical protein